MKLNQFKTKQLSLGHILVLWFLVLSLLPLSIVSWISYNQANTSLTNAAIHQLEEKAHTSVQLIKNWFDYRLMDVKNQADTPSTAQLLESLSIGFQQSGRPLREYVKSYDWAKRSTRIQNNLVAFAHNYDYIDDVLLLDINGNILYTNSKTSGLGMQLFDGPLANTLFSLSAQSTLISGKTTFSDLEQYAPPNDIYGFLNTLILNSDGDKLGVLSVMFNINRVAIALTSNNNQAEAIIQYLIGPDGKLRTPISNTGNATFDEINSILSPQYKHHKSEVHKKEHINRYIGPGGQTVIGTHSPLQLPGTTWTLVSEVDESMALAPAHWLRKVTLWSVSLTVIVVVLGALVLSRRLSGPIIALLHASQKAANGELNQRVDIKANYEIGKLASAFNHMLKIRQQYEEKLKNANIKIKLAYSDLTMQRAALDKHACIGITDLKGIIIFANDKFCETSGYDRHELLGQNHRILKSGIHENQFYKNIYDTISIGKTWHGEICNKSKQGKIFWVDSTIGPLLDAEGKPERYIAIRTDITVIKEAKEKAAAATQQKSEFLANMSHEIRTPMNGIIGMTGLLLDTPLQPQQREFAKNTMASAEALLTIINDILDFSKMEAGKMELEELNFDLRTLTEEVSEIMATKCREKNIEMLLRYKPDTPRMFIGDPGRIRQVLLNLLSNAIKFTSEGYILLSIEAQKLTQHHATLSVSVIDSGIGIDAKYLNKIFNKFDQEDGSTTRKYGGTGLGLAICQQLSQLMEGDITVESKKGHGSTFCFTMKLPLGHETHTKLILKNDVSMLHGLNTLIVDDLSIAQTIICEQLAKLKLNISTASSAKEALEKLTTAIHLKRPFDIVITDMQMPKMNGKMFAAEIKTKKLLAKGVLICVTSNINKEDLHHLKNEGFDAYLTKPTRPFELSHILSIIWMAKQQNKILPIITRHSLQTESTLSKQKITFYKTHILLAEDNPINQMVATTYLERYGCTITPAGNGFEAINQLNIHSFDLILMDCQMPEMDGFEATKIIRAKEKKNDNRRTPIIAFTANAMQGDKDKCLAAGMDDYISKPIDVKDLENILCQWLPNKWKKTHDINNLSKKPPINNSPNDTEHYFNSSNFETLKKLFNEEFPEAVEKYTHNSRENVGKIEIEMRQGDVKTIERLSHSIKGTSAQFGAIELSKIAKEMEQLAMDNNIEKIQTLFPKMKYAQQNVSQLMMKKIR